MLISIFCWLLLVEGVADRIGFLPRPLGIHLYAEGSLLQTPAKPRQHRREFFQPEEHLGPPSGQARSTGGLILHSCPHLMMDVTWWINTQLLLSFAGAPLSWGNWDLR